MSCPQTQLINQYRAQDKTGFCCFAIGWYVAMTIKYCFEMLIEVLNQMRTQLMKHFFLLLTGNNFILCPSISDCRNGSIIVYVTAHLSYT